MIKLISTPSKVMKNEKGAYLWKVSNGYRMSRKAKLTAGLMCAPETSPSA